MAQFFEPLSLLFGKATLSAIVNATGSYHTVRAELNLVCNYAAGKLLYQTCQQQVTKCLVKQKVDEARDRLFESTIVSKGAFDECKQMIKNELRTEPGYEQINIRRKVPLPYMSAPLVFSCGNVDLEVDYRIIFH